MDYKKLISEAREQANHTGDYRAYYEICNKNLEQYTGEIEYLTARGISKETATACKIGLDDSDDDKELAKLIIPYYEITSGQADADPNRYLTFKAVFMESGETVGDEYINKMGCLFNPQAFKRADNTHVYITLDVLDALSIEEAGGAAVAMLNYDALEEIGAMIEGTTARPVIAMSKTQEDKRAAQYIKLYLERIGKETHTVDLCKDHGTINEHLTKGRESFFECLRQAIPPAELYKAKNAAHMVDDLQAYIKASGEEKPISTGLTALDDLLDDGLKTGLYIIGAISSLGKTTFMLQIADYIALQGLDVLYFSLEQPSREIIAKSISRETYNEALKLTGSTNQAKSTTGILNGRHYAKYTDQEKQIIKQATAKYKEYGERIHIIDGIGEITPKRIEDAAREHESMTGNKPIIFIDYLQIMAPYEDPENPRRTYTDKQAIDKNILEIKRLSRNYTIVAISSFNRESYTEPLSMAAFKESGAIEYTSDVLIGLQYSGMDYQTTQKKDKAGNPYQAREKKEEHAARVAELIEGQKERARQGQAQTIQLKILKNRLYKTDSAGLQFYPQFNLYLDEGQKKGESTKDAQGFTMIAADSENPFTAII